MLAPEMGAPAFFILGVGRSGTSILGHALSLHGRLFVSHELRVLELGLHAAALLDQDGEPLGQEPRGYSPLGLAFGAAFVEALGAAQLEHEGKAGGVYADKYPPYTSKIAALKSLFPQARFVHILRDGRDVAASAARAFVADRGWRREREIPGMAQLALHWAREVALARRHAAALGPSRYRELRYEELVERPEPVLASLLEFLDLERDESLPRMAALLRPGPGWRTKLTQVQLAEFDAVAPARELLAELGYPPTPLEEGARPPAEPLEPRAAARAALASPRAVESLFAALYLREGETAEERAALAGWAEARGLDRDAARAVFGAGAAAP